MNDRLDLILGVDGGQSKTLTVLATTQGEVLGSAVTGPANHIHEPGGLERQYATLNRGYVEAFKDAGLAPTEVLCAYLGITGSGNIDVVRRAIPAITTVLKGDVQTALAGAIPELVGGIVIGGTGSAAYGQNADGKSARVGGWGYFAGDEGSGYDVSRMAFRAVYQGLDGRRPRTLLTDSLLAHFECADLLQLRRLIYCGELSREQLAGASVEVGRAAQAGDPIACEILAEAGSQLGLLASHLMVLLDSTSQPFRIAPVGGVFKSGSFVLTSFLDQMRKVNPHTMLTPPRYPPAIGAAIMALREIGVMIDVSILANLDKTCSRIKDKNNTTIGET